MKPHSLIAIVPLVLVSCQLEPAFPPVPEMPYRPRPQRVTAANTPATPAEQPQTTTWENTPVATSYISDAPRQTTPVQAPAPIPDPVAAAPTPAPSPAPVSVQPITPLESSPLLPASNPTAAASTPQSTDAQDLKNITNTGPIPTAMPVEGDPTRVWNPLDPSKKIRIINPKTNQPYPSGKKLKVRGTNFQFIVP